MQTPSIGRIVHYEDAKIGTIAAMITGVHEGGVNLTIFPPGRLPGYIGVGPRGSTVGVDAAVVAFADEPTPGHWNWPPRV